MRNQFQAYGVAGILIVALAALPGGRGTAQGQAKRSASMSEVRFMTLDPGHFHAGLVQKEMVPGVARRVDVYAPLGSDLLEHLNRIRGFNTRKDNPTAWELEVHAGPEPLERMLRERPGNVVVLSGRNDIKIDRIKASVEAGLHVLADKPWIIEPAAFPKLEAALETAERKGVIAYDIMTERFEITSLLQRELVSDAPTFGTIVPGSAAEPGVTMESVHYLFKTVAGLPNRRPAWFFDVSQQGEALPDVGTHLVDMVQWMLAPDKPIDHRKDVKVAAARRWATVMTLADFQKVTGDPQFPPYLTPSIRGGSLEYYCNSSVTYQLRGVTVKLDVLWEFEQPPGGGDTHYAVFRGSRARVEIRQKGEPSGRPELYVVPNSAAEKDAVASALRAKLAALAPQYPGLAVEDRGKDLRVTIPNRYHVGHEAHFAQVAAKFLGYLKDPKRLPAWEKPNMLAKYYTTTRGLELSRKNASASR